MKEKTPCFPHSTPLPRRATGVFREATEFGFGPTKGSKSPLATEGRQGGESSGVWFTPLPHGRGKGVGLLLFTFYILHLTLVSCSPAEDTYAHWPAYFTFTPVTSAPELYTAVNNMGQFCTVTPDGDNIVFASPHSSTPIRRSLIDQRVTLVLGLDGLIIGLPNIPEMGADVSRVVCYELSCPNCYEERGISRRLRLQDGGIARCQRCTRQ